MGRRIEKSEKAIFKSDYIRNLVGRRDGFRIAESSFCSNFTQNDIVLCVLQNVSCFFYVIYLVNCFFSKS